MSKTTRIICFAVLIALLFLVPATNASAALTRCRTDPIFKLSNGDVLKVTLEISTDSNNITNINYILHLPQGVKVTQVTYTAGAKKEMKETYVVYQDSPTKNYTIDTVVTTQPFSNVGVTVFAHLNGGIQKSVSGFNGQRLSITLNKP